MEDGDFVIVIGEADKTKKLLQHVAKIYRTDGEEGIEINYWKQDFDHHEIFRFTEEQIYDIPLTNIIMLLPKPLEIRSGVIFPGRLILKK